MKSLYPSLVDPRIQKLQAEIREVVGLMLEKVDIDTRAGRFVLQRIRAETNLYVGMHFDTIEEEIKAMTDALDALKIWNNSLISPTSVPVLH